MEKNNQTMTALERAKANNTQGFVIRGGKTGAPIFTKPVKEVKK